MTFDWFTLFAQLINFVLLLVLLRVFLYRPVLNIMEQREKRLSDTWAEAEQARSEAQAAAERLATERRGLEAERLQRLSAVEDEARQLLDRRLADVEAEVAASRRQQLAAAEENRERTVELLRQRSARLLVAELRASLEELAGSDLEQSTISVFGQRLRSLEQQQLNALRSAARTDTPIITTAFDPKVEGRSQLTSLLHEVLGSDTEPEFRQNEQLLFGVELTVGALRVSVSGSQRLESLGTAFNRALSELAAQRDSIRGGA